MPCRLPKNYSRELRFYTWLMLQKDPVERPSAKELLDFFDPLVDKSAAGIEQVKPQEGTGLETTTTIFSSGLKFTSEEEMSTEKKEESKALTSSGAGVVASKTSQAQNSEDVTEHLRSSQVLTVCSLLVF